MPISWGEGSSLGIQCKTYLGTTLDRSTTLVIIKHQGNFIGSTMENGAGKKARTNSRLYEFARLFSVRRSTNAHS